MGEKVADAGLHLEAGSETGAAKPAVAVVDMLPAESRPNPWGPGHRKLYLMCALVYLCSTMNGMNRILMDTFLGC